MVFGLQSARGKIIVKQVYCRQESEFRLILNTSPPNATYIRQWIGSALVQIMACRLFGTKPLSKPMQGYYQLDS